MARVRARIRVMVLDESVPQPAVGTVQHPQQRLYQSDAARAGIFSRRTNRTQATRVYSHGPIGHRTRGYILTMDPSDAGRAWSSDGYILTTDPSDAGRAGIFSRRTNRTQHAR
eukprot:497885-Pyramimonas_sp.AAC.1